MSWRNGWIKLHRKLLDNPVFDDARLLKTLLYCLLRANHEEKRVLWNGKEMVLKPGQFITGRETASGDLKFKSKMWDRKRDILENFGILTKQTTNRFTLITIINWDKYQLQDCGNDQATDQQMTNKRPADDQPMTTDKKIKNDKNNKKTPLGAKKPRPALGGLLGYFCEQFEKHMGRKYMPAFGKEGKFAKDILAVYGLEQAKQYVDAYFTLPTDDFLEDTGMTFAMFKVRIPKIILQEKKKHDDANNPFQ